LPVTYWTGDYYLDIQRTQILKCQKKKNTINKWITEMNSLLSEVEMHMVSKYKKRCLTTLSIREMPIKTPLRFYLNPVRMTIMRKHITVSSGEDSAGE
jgi:hypothetical protein